MTIPVYDLNVTHVHQLKRHFDALNDADAVLRFGNRPDREMRHAYVDGIDFTRDSVFGVYAGDLSLLGVAHLACRDGEGELGISVLPGHRFQGVGSALFDRAVTRARNRGIEELFMTCLAHNGAIMHIARKAGMKISIVQGGADAYLELPPGTALTLGDDLTEQGLASFDWALKANADYMRRLAAVIA